MQEAHHSVPQPAVSQALLVPHTRTLEAARHTASDSPQLRIWIFVICCLCYLDVLCQRVEDLLGHRQSPGEVLLARFIYDILPRVVPVEVADGLLMEGKGRW